MCASVCALLCWSHMAFQFYQINQVDGYFLLSGSVLGSHFYYCCFLPFFLFILFPSFRSEAKKTKVKKKTNNPHFDEVFYFEVGISKEWVISWNTILWIVGTASCSVLCQLSSLKTVSKHGAGGRSTRTQTGLLLKEQYPAFTSGAL